MVIVALLVLLSVGLLIGGQVFVASIRNKRADVRQKDVEKLREENDNLRKENKAHIAEKESLRQLGFALYHTAVGGSSVEPRLALEITERVKNHPEFKKHFSEGEFQ